MASNLERQTDEIEAISSICDEEEFFRIKGERYNLGLDIPPFLGNKILNVKYSSIVLRHAPTQPFYRFEVRNLPPACLRFRLPPEYPSSAPPEYILDVTWLPPWENSLVCQRLDELANNNRGSEVLFLWQDFLRNEILTFLRYDETLDVSFLFVLHSEPRDIDNRKLLALADSRAKNGAMYLHPMKYLRQFDETRRGVVLARSSHFCGICCGEFSGKGCTEFRDCGHVYCKRCVAEYFATRIGEGNVARMPCPDLHCYSIADSKQIRDLCPDLYSKYEELLLRLTLQTMNDVVFCPRVCCQFPVIVADSEALASCRKCGFNFCFYCRKVYHGIAACDMSSADSDKLIVAYLKGNDAERKLLTKKHGRRQIQTVVEIHLTKKYIEENTKPCPKCHASTQKVGGCNKMICAHCQTHFCWICGLRITESNSYEHFTKTDGENPCYGRLFEGLLKNDNDLPLHDEPADAINEAM